MTSIADLPLDILSIIFDKVGSYGILMSAQYVCKEWYALSLNPRTWRRIYTDNLGPNALKGVVDRSIGGLVKFEGYGVSLSKIEMGHIFERSPQLKKITFLCDGVLSTEGSIKEVLAKASRSCPLLNDIGMYGYRLCKNEIEFIGNLFPHLKKFRLQKEENFGSVVEIARSMSGLIELQLMMCNIENDDFHAILDGCPHLKFLGVITETYSDIFFDDVVKERLKNIQACEIYDELDYNAVPFFKHGKTKKDWISKICIY